MTAPARTLASVPALDTPAARGWLGWLTDHIRDDWRLTEWQEEFWLFTGSLDEPTTSVSRCRTSACETVVSPSNGYCPLCREVQKTSTLTDADFAATFQAVRTRRSFGQAAEACTVEREGQRCVRPAQCKGLCAGHYAQRRSHRKRRDARPWQNVAVPYTEVQPCPVPACPLPSLHTDGLCRYHVRRFREHRRTEHPPQTPMLQWAAQQAPYLAPHQFSLIPLPEPLRQEILYGLQQADPWLRIFEPAQARRLVRHLTDPAHPTPTTLTTDVSDKQLCPRASTAVLRLLNRTRHALRAGYAQYTGADPDETDLLDLRALGQQARSPKSIKRPKVVDLTTISQRWLRDLLRTWTVQQLPGTDEFARTLRSAELASRALAPRPGTDDPAALGYDDVTAVVDSFRSALKLNGEPAGWNYRMSIASHFFALIDYGRRSGTVAGLAAAFIRDPTAHRIPQEEAGEDEIGKAIPEPVIRQLDAHLDLLGQGRTRGQRTLAPADLHRMYRTLYILLKDTGRRPAELLSLPLDCLETRSDQISLIWHNHKARRRRRRLPITASTAQAIRTWRTRRDQLQPALPATGAGYLFPALTHLATGPHLPTGYLSETLRHWVDAIPQLYGEGVDDRGDRLPFDRSLIYPYAFRHSYAQRHADAGTPLDVLRELMDHKSVSTTQRYYTVSVQRKRDAVTKLAAHVVDSHGHPTPSTETAYELRSVAVPYGGCTEPSNVKAGGGSCPIRFQCAGCGFYRPDPSYLPAIEQHINELRADRETAQAMDAAEFVITGLAAQITAFENVVDRMHRRLAGLPAAERAQIEEASSILRKARAGASRTLLPLADTRPDPS